MNKLWWKCLFATYDSKVDYRAPWCFLVAPFVLFTRWRYLFIQKRITNSSHHRIFLRRTLASPSKVWRQLRSLIDSWWRYGEDIFFKEKHYSINFGVFIIDSSTTQESGGMLELHEYRFSYPVTTSECSLISRCRIVLRRHVTEIISVVYTQKKKKQIVDKARKGKHVKVWWSWSFLIVILFVVISKYWTICLHQSVSVKFSWCEIKAK